MAKPLTIYKLIVLYMLDRVSFPMTNDQISEYILTKGYMDYFKLQQTISELVDTELVKAEVIRNNTYYNIVPKGREVCHYFQSKISAEIRHDIKQYIKDNEYELREEVSVLASYYRTVESEFMVECVVKEQGEDLVKLALRVSTEEQANTICNTWKDKSSDVYAYLVNTLLKDN